jgi:hypothetical protein
MVALFVAAVLSTVAIGRGAGIALVLWSLLLAATLVAKLLRASRDK